MAMKLYQELVFIGDMVALTAAAVHFKTNFVKGEEKSGVIGLRKRSKIRLQCFETWK